MKQSGQSNKEYMGLCMDRKKVKEGKKEEKNIDRKRGTETFQRGKREKQRHWQKKVQKKGVGKKHW